MDKVKALCGSEDATQSIIAKHNGHGGREKIEGDASLPRQLSGHFEEMSDRNGNEYRSNGGADNSEADQERKRSPNQFTNFVNIFRVEILGNKFYGSATQPQVENIEIAEQHHSDGENAVLSGAQSSNNERNGGNADGHGQNLAEKVENSIFCDYASTAL